MDESTIELLIKWGPVMVAGVLFLFFFIVGAIRGSYKVFRRFLFVALFATLMCIFIMPITTALLDLKITINGVQGVRNFIVKFLEDNEAINKFLSYSSDLKEMIIDYPEIVVAPILYLVSILILLPLSFLNPIYWLYLIIYHIIAKYVFDRRKYEVGEDGKVLRNEKGKKIKVKRKKYRLLGGLIRGVQSVAIFCLALLPVNFVNRIYTKTKKVATIPEGKNLCDTVDQLKDYSKYCDYVDLYNEGVLAKITGENSLDEKINDKLTTIKVDGKEVNLEDEITSVTKSAVYLNESGLLQLFLNKELDLKNLDLSTINFDKISSALDSLLDSKTLSTILETGVKYVMNEVLKDKLVDVLKDDDIVSKLEYANADEIRQELKDVIAVLKLAVDSEIDKAVLNNTGDVVAMMNAINEDKIGEILNKLLSLKIVSRAMPSVLEAYTENYGVTIPETMTTELNNQISSPLIKAIKLVKTLNLTSMSELTEGNIVDNLANKLFENGVLKEATRDELATLLNEINTSYLFKDVLSTVANKFLEGKDYKVDARVLKYVTSVDEWKKELAVLDSAYSLYDGYKTNETIDYSKVDTVLDKISGTKVMISILPFAYDSLLEKIGLTVDSATFPEIDFGEETENTTKANFYNTWNAELLALKKVSDGIGDLELQSFDDISTSLLNDTNKVDALSSVMAGLYESTLLKDSFADFMKDKMNDFVSDYGVEFTKADLLSISTKAEWKNEFTNINTLLNTDFNNINSTTLGNTFTAIESIKMFETKKVALLKYAIKNSGILSDEEYSSINWPTSTEQDDIDAFWSNETTILKEVIDDKDTITDLASTGIESMDTNKVGNIINKVMDSEILKPVVVNKVTSLFVDNGVKSDRDTVANDTTNTYLKQDIENVEDWKVDLAYIKDMLNITEDNMNTVVVGETKTTIEKMFDNIDASDLLKDTKANLLLKIVDTIDITEVPASVTVATLKENDYAKYNNEKNVIIEVAKNKSTFDTIATMDMNAMDTDKIGGLLNTVTSSIIFKDYVVDQIEDVLVTNNVKSDRDTVAGDTTNTYLKQDIASVEDWKVDLAYIKDMLSITEDNMNTVESGKTKIEKMFDNIDASDLLKDTRANLLLKVVTTIDITEVPASVTVATLKENDYAKYNNEKNVIIEVAENKSTFDTIATMDMKVMDTTKVGGLLNTVTSSIIFKDYVVDQIKDVMISNGVKDDRDSGSDTTNLESSIGGVANWTNELDTIKSMLNMTSDTFNTIESGNSKTNLELMFDSIDSSAMLSNAKANLLIKIVDTINMSGVSSSNVSVSTLKANSYENYNKEKTVFVEFAKNKDAVEGLTDITSLNDQTKGPMATMLDAMKESTILEGKYISTLDSALTGIRGNTTLTSYGVNFKSKEDTNNYKNITWSTEIDNLLTINNNVADVASYNASNINTDKDAKIAKIGTTLDAVSASGFLGETEAQKIANSVVTALTKGTPLPTTSITKNANETWTDAFNRVLNVA